MDVELLTWLLQGGGSADGGSGDSDDDDESVDDDCRYATPRIDSIVNAYSVYLSYESDGDGNLMRDDDSGSSSSSSSSNLDAAQSILMFGNPTSGLLSSSSSSFGRGALHVPVAAPPFCCRAHLV